MTAQYKNRVLAVTLDADDPIHTQNNPALLADF